MLPPWQSVAETLGAACLRRMSAGSSVPYSDGRYRETPPYVPNHSEPSEATTMSSTMLSARPSVVV